MKTKYEIIDIENGFNIKMNDTDWRIGVLGDNYTMIDNTGKIFELDKFYGFDKPRLIKILNEQKAVLKDFFKWVPEEGVHFIKQSEWTPEDVKLGLHVQIDGEDYYLISSTTYWHNGHFETTYSFSKNYINADRSVDFRNVNLLCKWLNNKNATFVGYVDSLLN